MSEFKLTPQFSSDLRYTAFVLGNGNFIISDTDINYIPFIIENPKYLVDFFTLYFHLDNEGGELSKLKAWLKSICDSSVENEFKIDQRYFNSQGLYEPQKTVIEFTELLSSNKLSKDLLTENNILEELFDTGSPFEQVYALLANLLVGDPERQTITSNDYIFARTSQMVKDWICPSYRPNPYWADWEVELW